MGPVGIPGRKKSFDPSKAVPSPIGLLKQLFLARFAPVVMRFGPWEIPKCLENGSFCDEKMRQKTVTKVFFQKGSYTIQDVQTSVFSLS